MLVSIEHDRVSSLKSLTYMHMSKLTEKADLKTYLPGSIHTAGNNLLLEFFDSRSIAFKCQY